MVVRNKAEEMGLNVKDVQLGELETSEELSEEEKTAFGEVLRQTGFELIDDRKTRMIEKIKNTIVELVHYTEEQSNLKHSEYISRALNYDYPYLSKIFSEVEGVTIEHYIINQKIERAKELLMYDEHSLNEIAYMLGYSSVQHLSQQFKKVTGLNATHFKRLKENSRKPLDKI
jgi:AraC-like DNA-binding protein